jgi:hypothetical protein
MKAYLSQWASRHLHYYEREAFLIVPDLGSRIRDVVLVRRIFSSGKPQGVGFWNGEGMGRGWEWGDQFMSNLGPRWMGSYHIKEGFQVSEGKWKRGKGESEKGSKKARGLCHN